jgi:predicted nuclease of restriction endonuclease-like (RecB) superfamily
VHSSQSAASLAVNRELISLYWHMGREIILREEATNWGTAVLEVLSRDLQTAFPGVSGFSRRNLYRIRAFYLAYSQVAEPLTQAAQAMNEQKYEELVLVAREFVPQAVAQIPWGHNTLLLEKVKDSLKRQWYAERTFQEGWSRTVLTYQIETDLYTRQVESPKSSNFARTLPPPQSDLVAHLQKDPYIFDFVTLGPDARERDLERSLINKIREFLLELGQGFAFLGSQYPLEVGGQDFYLDLLFYHHRLRCLVTIDLKMDEFKPEFAGKMNFYLTALDKQVRHADDQPSVGIILCKSKNSTLVEYALHDMNKPIGVSEYQYTNSLPSPMDEALPSPLEWTRLLERATNDQKAEQGDENLH